MTEQQKDPEFEHKDGLVLIKHQNGVCAYQQLYDVEHSIDELFTAVEALTPRVTKLWGRPSSLQQVLSTRNDNGTLTLHFYDFNKAPEPLAWMARGAHGKLYWEIDSDHLELRHLRMLLWIITVMHPTVAWYNPDTISTPEGFKVDYSG